MSHSESGDRRERRHRTATSPRTPRHQNYDSHSSPTLSYFYLFYLYIIVQWCYLINWTLVKIIKWVNKKEDWKIIRSFKWWWQVHLFLIMIIDKHGRRDKFEVRRVRRRRSPSLWYTSLKLLQTPERSGRVPERLGMVHFRYLYRFDALTNICFLCTQLCCDS